MQLRRWLGLAATAPALVLVLMVLFAVGATLGLNDTPNARFALAGTAIVSGQAGWLLSRRVHLRRAAWLLPAGVGVALAGWLPLTTTAGLSLPVAVTVLLAWTAALTALSVASAALARRSALAAGLVAVVGAVAIVVLVPALAVRVGAGAGMLAPGSLATWAPALVSDESYGLAPAWRAAAELASTFMALVLIGTSYVTSYVVGLGRSGGTPLAAPAAVGPQIAT